MKSGIDAAANIRNHNSKISDLNTMILKQYVLQFKDDHPEFVRFLSFIVSFPVSEAIVESWGSSLEYIYRKKHNIKDGSGLKDVGTVDMLAFIKLNGPPPCMLSNKELYEKALCMKFKGEYRSHFIYSARHLKTTSRVIEKIQKGCDVLPCYLK